MKFIKQRLKQPSLTAYTTEHSVSIYLYSGANRANQPKRDTTMNAISSSDPQAVELLTAKLAKLEDQRDNMKKANKAYKLAIKYNVAGHVDVAADVRRAIATKSDMSFTSDLLTKAIAFEPPTYPSDSSCRIMFLSAF